MWRRAYRIPEPNVEALAQELQAWYRAQGFQVALDRTGGRVVIRAWRPTRWQAALGLTPTWQVGLHPHPEGLTVEMDVAYQVDPAVAGPTGHFLLWAVLFAATYADWLRVALPRQTWQTIEYLLATGRPPPAPRGDSGV
ncbi:hypothetical protein FKZ61_005990 [Litorilinea aerophila]|uniref:Uncharacterized protein n=1 Tax=Litorilinea aerophila TaxID=1204385 RepID=A0A540VJ64_9CHLR|nr:hypothetical protein [Litorilinea aerophila]MCC9075663.1 hypothetical protein [Litorilinea aerophila]OUC06558.1 hypothetical protein RY27_20290 [Litorilinea aerophila]GIV80240.1 MAG: hypothetical protein KatS3mg050_4634 [Litorilinea sp.]